MAVSVAGAALGRESHSMIEFALRTRLSQPPLASGGRRHLPDVAVDREDAAPVMVLPSLATTLPLSLSSPSSSSSSSQLLISIQIPFRLFAGSPWNSLLVAFAST